MSAVAEASAPGVTRLELTGDGTLPRRLRLAGDGQAVIVDVLPPAKGSHYLATAHAALRSCHMYRRGDGIGSLRIGGVCFSVTSEEMERISAELGIGIEELDEETPR